MKIRTTKGQRKKLYESDIGRGFLALKSGFDEVTEIEFYVGRDNVIRRVGDGKPIFPVTVIDPKNGPINVTAAHINRPLKKCGVCNGRGFTLAPDNYADTCDYCNGTGEVKI